MQEFIAAGAVTCLLRRANFVGQPHHFEMQDTPAFSASEEVKALRIQVLLNGDRDSGYLWSG
jgi:hypothetical protein